MTWHFNAGYQNPANLVHKTYFCHYNASCYNIGLDACFHFKSHAIDNRIFKCPREISKLQSSHMDTWKRDYQ